MEKAFATRNERDLERGGTGAGAANANASAQRGGPMYHMEVDGTGAEGAGDVSQMETSIRLGFVRKVYGILGIQLLVTFGIAAMLSIETSEGSNPIRNSLLTTTDEGYEVLSATGGALFWISLILTFGTVIALSCVPGAARKSPQNFLLLAVFTGFEGVLIGLLSLRYDAVEIGIAIGIVALIVILLSLFACQTKIDFTGAGPYLFVALITLIIFGIFFAWTQQARTIYAAFGVLLFSFYLVYDTQLIVGGKHKKYQFSVDDYVFGALSLYLDIINLFMLILCLGGDN